MAENTVSITITGDSASAVAALKKVEAGLKEVGSESNKTASFTDTLKKNWLAMTAATAGAVLVIKQVVTLAADAAKNQYMLGAAMKQAGTYTEEAYRHNLNFAKSLQMITAYGDDEIYTVQKALTVYGVEGEMLDKLTKATLDLASAKGIDLKQAGELVARSVGTATNALARQGIVIEGAAGSTARMNSALNNLTTLFGGSAQAYAQTFSGKVKMMQEALEDVGEEIGNVIIPILVPMVQKIKELAVWFAGLPQPIKTAAVALVGLAIAIKGISIAAAFLNLNPVVLAIAGVAAIVLVTTSAMKKMQDESRSSAEALRMQADEERALATAILLEKTTRDALAQATDEQTQKGLENELVRTQAGITTAELRVQLAKNEYERRLELEKAAADNSISIEADLENRRFILGETGIINKEKWAARAKAISDAQDRGNKISADKQKKLEEEVLNFKKSMISAGVNAVVGAAASEKATIGSVAAAMIEAVATALSQEMTIRAIAALVPGPTFNPAAAAGYIAAAIAIKAAGARVGMAIRGDVKKMATGGILDEPVAGVGQRTGQQYLLGEAGTETVTTVTPGTNGGGGNIYINNIVINAQDSNDVKRYFEDLQRQTGSRSMRR